MRDVRYSPRLGYIIPVLMFLLPLLVYNVRFRYLGAGDTAPNELLPISIIYERNLDFNEFVAEGDKLPYWLGKVNDKIVSMYPILPGMLNLPVYFIAHALGVNLYEERFLLSMLSSSIIASISVVFMYLCLERLLMKRSTAAFFALIYAFATPVFSVASRGMWQHGPALLFATLSLFLLVSKSSALVPYSGLFLGMAVLSRAASVLLALPLTFYVLFHHRHVFGKYIVLAGIPAIFLALYSQVYWGTIISTGEGYGSPARLSGSLFPGLVGLLISPSRGLFIFSPIFLFSFDYLLVKSFSKQAEPICKYLSIAVASMLVLYSNWDNWWGGHSFGYRLLTELVPMLVIFLALNWERAINGRWPVKAIFLILLLGSIYVQFLGAFYYPCSFNRVPNNIDFNTERLWDFGDTELTRCSTRFLQDLDSLPGASQLP